MMSGLSGEDGLESRTKTWQEQSCCPPAVVVCHMIHHCNRAVVLFFEADQHKTRPPLRLATMSQMRFCGECNNMLYPKENKQSKSLMYACRNCDFSEEVDDKRIYVNRFVVDTSTKLEQVHADLALDPTLQRSNDMQCEVCGHYGVVFFQAHGNVKAQSLSLIFMCCNPQCSHKWVG